MPLKKQINDLKKLAQIVDSSAKDASRARKVSRSQKMQQEIASDRRKGLAKNFRTVRQALADRERLAKKTKKAR